MNTTQVTTKADLVETKSELKKDIAAVKSELKADIKAVKSDLKSLHQNVLKIEERVENLEEGQERIETILKRMESTLDGFVGRVDNLTIDNEVGTHQTRELQRRIDNHEKRLQQIESTKHTT